MSSLLPESDAADDWLKANTYMIQFATILLHAVTRRQSIAATSIESRSSSAASLLTRCNKLVSVQPICSPCATWQYITCLYLCDIFAFITRSSQCMRQTQRLFPPTSSEWHSLTTCNDAISLSLLYITVMRLMSAVNWASVIVYLICSWHSRVHSGTWVLHKKPYNGTV